MQSMAHNASYLGLEALLTWDRAQWASRADERSEAARHASALFHRMGSPQLARASAAAAEGQAAPGPWVTVREREVGRMVAEGLTDREIADRLGISPRTVDRHLRNLFQKLQVSNRAALAAHVVRRHWA
jgi:DNA-binding CsgD family transcriptional regulator